ncbi:MAG: hypothetical protein V1493_03590, partial [Candidatus Diapherotrites archaeon]
DPTTSFQNYSAKAAIKGKEVTLVKGDNVFTGTISPDYSFKNMELLEVELLQGTSKRATQKFPIFFSPAELAVKTSPFEGKALYIGSPVGKLDVAVQLPDGGIPAGGKFAASIDSGGKELEKKKQLEKNQQVFSADFPYILAVEDYAAGAVLKISGSDSAGNALAETSLPLELKKDNPLFNLKFDSPDPEQTKTLRAGQKLQVSASFESGAGAQDARIWVFVPATNERKELSGQGGVFSGEITLPESSQGKIRLIIYGTAKAGGTEVGDMEEAEFSLSKELTVSFVYPAEGAVQQQGDGRTMIVSVSLPNGQAPQKSSFRGSLFIGGKKQDVLLTRSAEKNQYTIKLENAVSGKQTLKLVLADVDGLGGSAEINTDISQQFDWFGLLLLVLVIGALAFFANLIRSKFKAGTRGTGTAKAGLPPEKKDFVKEEKKRLEIEFYKRRISEEEFKERMLELQKGERAGHIQPKEHELNEIKFGFEKEAAQEKPQAKTLFGRLKPAPAMEEDRARQVIEKRLGSEDALSPLIIGRDSEKPKAQAGQTAAEEYRSAAKQVTQAQQRVMVEEFRPAQKQGMPAQAGPSFPKPKETLSVKKIGDVRAKIDMLAKQGPLSSKDDDAVNELVFALKPKAFAYTRNEIFESVIGEGFSERIAAEVVKRIFG